MNSTPKPQTDQSVDDLLNSLTGFDELAINKAFGADVFDLAERQPTMYVRALIFIHFTRAGQDAGAAKKASMGMTIKQAQDFFPEGDEEFDPETPVTEAGKKDAPSA